MSKNVFFSVFTYFYTVFFLKKEYTDILPIMLMVNEKVAMSYLLDMEEEETVYGRFYDYEDIIEVHSGAILESLLVTIDCVDSS
jgi:hypothetical protein